MRDVKDVDIYVAGELALAGVMLNYEAFDLNSEQPQVVTATAFLPDDERFANDQELVIDFKDGIYARVKIFASDLLCDERQCDMRFVDAGRALEELL
jgi:hypothetical protein